MLPETKKPRTWVISAALALGLRERKFVRWDCGTGLNTLAAETWQNTRDPLFGSD